MGGRTRLGCSTPVSCSRPTRGLAWTDERIADALETVADTVARERGRFSEDALEVALMPRKPGKPRSRVLDGRAEARLVALACSDPPEGRASWTLRLLAEVREPLSAAAGFPERRDHVYERRGMAHLFVAYEPLAGKRSVEVRERRRGREFAEFVRHVAEDLSTLRSRRYP